ncbi:20560_t:CDS:1, partial [Racocetra persica]
NSCAARPKRRIGRIKQPKRVRRPRIRKNNLVIIPPRPKGLYYAKIPVLALSDSMIDKLITWRAKKYRDILNKNGKVTNQYKEDLYIKRIGRNDQVQYSLVHKLIEIRPIPRSRASTPN